MAKRIGVLEAEQPLDSEPRSHVSKNAAAYLVRKVLAAWVPGRRVIQKLAQKAPELAAQLYREITFRFSDGPLGVGNALPFSRHSDGSRLHYEIGPRSLWAKYGYYRREDDEGNPHRFIHRKVIKVSARSRFSHQSLDFPGTHNSALALADALR